MTTDNNKNSDNPVLDILAGGINLVVSSSYKLSVTANTSVAAVIGQLGEGSGSFASGEHGKTAEITGRSPQSSKFASSMLQKVVPFYLCISKGERHDKREGAATRRGRFGSRECQKAARSGTEG